ncbi:MAG: NUDIX domain-containing protein [Parcubacteria group bacterium]|nr:NUDIX domain-containing protein [Parcubacteria group bacterium]
MILATLCYLVKGQPITEILLGLKVKEALGQGKYNGLGGKKEAGETIEVTAIREVYDETGKSVRVREQDLEKVAVLYSHFPARSEWDAATCYSWREGESRHDLR